MLLFYQARIQSLWQIQLRRPIFILVGPYKERRCLILPTLMIRSLVHVFVLCCPCLRLIAPSEVGISQLISRRCTQTILSTSYNLSLKRQKPLPLPSMNFPSRPIAHHLSNQLSKHFEISTIARLLTCYLLSVYQALFATRLIQAFPANSLMHFPN